MATWTPPWPEGAATGSGPLPGTDEVEAARVVFGELPELPHLPELPDRGVGADAVGRTASLLVDLHVDVHAGRWRLVTRPTGDERRGRRLLERDLDALEEVGGAHRGPLKLQVVGPWTLAASLELARGERAVVDQGAVRDLADSLAEGLARHVGDVRRRVPGAERLLIQLDEPLLPAVVAGALPTASGWGRVPAVEEHTAQQVLGGVLAAAGKDGGVACPGTRAPVGLARRAGARFVALEGEVLESVDDEDLGSAVEEGAGLLVALVPGPGDDRDLETLARPLRRVWSNLGMGPERLGQVVVTPAADLAGLGPDDVVAVLRRCHELARRLHEDPGPPAG
ncbi:MAG: methionine synthase [Actinomycetota bacterium]|nr:methionine synthase [Actinomycetota bacterium]